MCTYQLHLQKDNFLEHLVQYTNCCSDHPMLLILDSHEAHISLKAVDIAKSEGAVLLTILPHTSNRMQPPDKIVDGPFKTYYNRALDGWMRSNPGKTAIKYQITECVNKAFMSAMTPWNISPRFRSTEISPYNRGTYDAEFAPSMVSDRRTPGLQSPTAVDPSTEGDPPAADDPSTADDPPTTSTSKPYILPSSTSTHECALPGRQRGVSQPH